MWMRLPNFFLFSLHTLKASENSGFLLFSGSIKSNKKTWEAPCIYQFSLLNRKYPDKINLVYICISHIRKQTLTGVLQNSNAVHSWSFWCRFFLKKCLLDENSTPHDRRCLSRYFMKLFTAWNFKRKGFYSRCFFVYFGKFSGQFYLRTTLWVRFSTIKC